MSLIEVKRYLMRVRIASLQHLCQMFNSQPQALRSLLEHLVRAGKIRRCKKTPACGTKCAQCPSAAVELYEWIGTLPV